jgi:hypothetical protein
MTSWKSEMLVTITLIGDQNVQHLVDAWSQKKKDRWNEPKILSEMETL